MKDYIKIEKREITLREKEVLCLVKEGLTNAEIADKLNITIHTVKAHVSSLMYKLETRSRLELAIKAIKKEIEESE